MSDFAVPPVVYKFIDEIGKPISKNIKIIQKKQSKLMRFVNFFIKIFNKDFMTKYHTTIGNTIYLNDDFSNYSPSYATEIIAHEVKHVSQYNKFGFLFSLIYMFPQSLFLISLFSIFAFVNLYWLFCLLTILFLAPLPAYFRYKFELEGYRTSLIFGEKREYTPEQLLQLKNFIAEQLTGSFYYFAWPFKKWIMNDLNKNEFRNEEYYKKVEKFIEDNGLSTY